MNREEIASMFEELEFVEIETVVGGDGTPSMPPGYVAWTPGSGNPPYNPKPFG